MPTPVEDAEPFEGQGPHGSLVCFAVVPLLLIIDLRPEGMPRRFSRPLHERLTEERRTLEAPVHPRLLATAFRDWRNARLFVEILGRGVAFPWCATGHEEARSQDGSGPWQGVKQGEVGMVLGTLCDGVVEVGNGLQRDAELGDEGVHQEGVGDDDTFIGGQRHRTLDGLNARLDDVGRAHVVGTEEALKGGAPREKRWWCLSPETTAGHAERSL